MKFGGKHSFEPIPLLVGSSIAMLFAWGLSYWSGLNFWVGLAVAVIALIANGWVAEAEDNAPGGFHNPPPPNKPTDKEENTPSKSP